MSAALAIDYFDVEACLPYNFVYLDNSGHFHSTGRHLFADDKAAIDHARRLLNGSSLVVVYQDDRKVSVLANLC
ncbi:MAG: hypothetical protein WDN45_13975 [Caulobacteraceae bacterium]